VHPSRLRIDNSRAPNISFDNLEAKGIRSLYLRVLEPPPVYFGQSVCRPQWRHWPADEKSGAGGVAYYDQMISSAAAAAVIS